MRGKGSRKDGGYSSPYLSQGKRRSRQATAVGQILARALKNYGLEQDLARYQFVLSWKDIVGPEIAKRSKPLSLKNGVLTVSVCSSAWAQELAFQKPILLSRLKKHLSNNESVKDIFFRVQVD